MITKYKDEFTSYVIQVPVDTVDHFGNFTKNS